jgi:hypothetical protein
MYKYEIDGIIFYEGDKIHTKYHGDRGVVIRPDAVKNCSRPDPSQWVYCELSDGNHVNARPHSLILTERKREETKKNRVSQCGTNYLSIVLSSKGEE